MTVTRRTLCVFLSSEEICVPRTGIEPAQPKGHRFLKPARLPVPPPRHVLYYTLSFQKISTGNK